MKYQVNFETDGFKSHLLDNQNMSTDQIIMLPGNNMIAMWIKDVIKQHNELLSSGPPVKWNIVMDKS